MNRRDLSRSVIALPAGFVALHALPVPALAAPPAADPDAELLSLCRRHLSMARRLYRLAGMEMDANTAGDKELEERLAAIQGQFHSYQMELHTQIMDLKAMTAAGVRAKAQVAATCINYWLTGEPTLEHRDLWSICRDLLGYAPTEDGGEA